MRRRNIIVVLPALIALAIYVFLLRTSSPFKPNISITPEKYERSRWRENIEVQIAITNTGVVVLVPEDSNVFDPDAFIRVDLPAGWTNTPGPSTLRYSHATRLRPGQAMNVNLSLPGNARRWQVGYLVQSASSRETAAFLTSRWSKRLMTASQRILSDKQGPSRMIWSDIFEVPSHIQINPTSY